MMSDPRVVRFLQLLIKRGFVEQKLVTISGLQKNLFHFGPLGTLLKKNILKQWWDAVVLEQPNTYCVENPLFIPSPDAAQNDKNLSILPDLPLRTSLSSDCQSAYLSALNVNGGQLPVSVASCGQCFPPPHDDGQQVPHDSSGRLLSNGVGETQLLVQHYVPPANAAQVLDFCLRTRLRWWRHFCSKPSKLSSSSSTLKGQSEESNETVITYDFPWGSEPVERIANLGDASVQEMEKRSGVSHQGKYHRKAFHPYLIECQTSAEQCMSVFLTDSYRERELKKKVASKNHTTLHLVLQLHSLLTPYQVAMSVTGSRAAEVRVLVDKVARELREAGISVLNTAANSGSMDAQYSRNDELGVPYTVVMSDQTLDTGIISIRDRDTRLKQQQHISKLQSLLSKSIRAQDLD